MLSDRYFKLIGFQVTIASLIAGSPFNWDGKQRRLYVTRLSYWKYQCAVGLMVGYGCFLFVQLVRYHRMGKTTGFYYYFLYALTICCIFDTIAAYPVLRRPKLAAAVITELWHFLDDLAREYMPNFHPNKSISNWILDTIVFLQGLTYPFLGLIISCHYLIFPEWPCYLSSLVPPEMLTWYIILPTGLTYFYGLQMVWAILLNFSVILMTVGYLTWQITNEYFCFPESARSHRPPKSVKARQIWAKQRTISAFRSYEILPLKYRELQILQLNLMEVYSSMIVPMQTTVTNLGLFCNVSLIKYRQMLNLTNTFILLLWTVGASSGALVGLTFCGAMHNKSLRLLKTMRTNDWGSRGRTRVMAKFVRSCKPISYGYGSVYVIKKVSVLKFLRTLTRGTFRALLTLK